MQTSFSTLAACGTFLYQEVLMKYLFAISVFGLVVLCNSGCAQVNSPDSIIYNQSGNEVGVIQRETQNGSFVVLPTAGTLDLGYYDIILSSASLRRRSAGGWVTSLNNEQIASVPPSTERYWQASGD
jgi:hypothetical protein